METVSALPAFLEESTADRMIILGMGSANERRRYIVLALFSWSHTQNDSWYNFY